jgi:hypothetical protein
MDSTFKTTKYNLPLYFICVLTNMGYHVVASFIIGNDNSDEISQALSIIKQWNPGWRPKGFMCDLDQREINACERVFEGMNTAFHKILYQFQKMIIIIGMDVRLFIIQIFHCIQTS